MGRSQGLETLRGPSTRNSGARQIRAHVCAASQVQTAFPPRAARARPARVSSQPGPASPPRLPEPAARRSSPGLGERAVRRRRQLECSGVGAAAAAPLAQPLLLLRTADCPVPALGPAAQGE